MKLYTIIISILVLLFTISVISDEIKQPETIYDINAVTIEGDTISLSQYKGKVILIVNVASYCGFTKQYDGLQLIYDEFKDKDVVVLGFPCNQFGKQEPGTNKEIKKFCEEKYGVTFPLFSKIDVNGENAHPLYKYLKSAKSGMPETDIKWNFTKFLIDKKGKARRRYTTQIDPHDIEADIEAVLNER